VQLIYANFCPFCSSLFYTYFPSHVTSTHGGYPCAGSLSLYRDEGA
jgi:hypothetical protein